jgi:hypothetical protein
MKRRGAIGEINSQSATREEVAPDKNVVWRIKGAETHNLSLDIAAWQRDADAEEWRRNRGKPRVVSFSPPSWQKIKSGGQRFADACSGRAGIDLREGFDSWPSIDCADGDLNGRAMLDDVIDRLADSELGPNGFFIVCHRDSRQR